MSAAIAACAFAYFYEFKNIPFGTAGHLPLGSADFGRLEQRQVREAHNLEVVGSSPTPATKENSFVNLLKYRSTSAAVGVFLLYGKGRCYRE